MDKICLFILFAYVLLSCSTQSNSISLQTEQPTLPVLAKKKVNPVLKIKLIRNKAEDYSLQNVCLSFIGTTDIHDIEEIGLYQLDKNGMIDSTRPLNASFSISDEPIIQTNIPIQTDTFQFWISLKLKDKIDLSHRFHVACLGIETDKGIIDFL